MTATPSARLWVLRHGQSTANLERRIVSLPGPEALSTVGLTEQGRAQAREAGARARTDGLLGADTIVVSSDYARALHTAEEFAAQLGAPAPIVDQRLRERGFGEYDGGPDDAYAAVWAQDAAGVTPTRGVESVESVAARVSAVIQEVRRRYTGSDVVLVAHGDVLQIALILAAGRPAREHRDQSHLTNAELRRLPCPASS